MHPIIREFLHTNNSIDEILIKVCQKDQYLESVFYSQLFSVTLALRLPLSLISTVTQSKITFIPKKLLYWTNTIPSVVFIISLYLLTKPFGVNGVIVSKIMLLIVSLATTYYVIKTLKLKNL